MPHAVGYFMRLFAIYLTLGFIWLSYASLHQEVHHVASIAPLSFKQRQAAALQAVYGITDAEVAKPVDIFGQ